MLQCLSEVFCAVITNVITVKSQCCQCLYEKVIKNMDLKEIRSD
jgi:hypothetical protein